MSIPRLAYIVQLDLPGHPIKIGCTKNPWSRFDAFSHGTPVACRFVGLTINGIEREKEMLDATASAKIKGEWRYETQELLRTVYRYHAAGEWLTYCPERYDADDIRARILAAAPSASRYLDGRTLSPRSISYAWANDVLRLARDADPLLGAHWAGFHIASAQPSLRWPDSRLEIAA